MKNNYDFSKSVKNPYVDKLKKGYTVAVHYDFTKDNSNEELEEKTVADKIKSQFVTQ